MVVGLPADEARRRPDGVAAMGLADLVTVRPWLNRTEFERSFVSAALVVFPSDYEGFGLPAIEAMRLGIPLVITPDKALLEATGGLVTVMDGWDAASLARAVPRARRTSSRRSAGGVSSTPRSSHGGAWPATWRVAPRTATALRQSPRLTRVSAAAGEDDQRHPHGRRQDGARPVRPPPGRRPGLEVLLQPGPPAPGPVEVRRRTGAARSLAGVHLVGGPEDVALLAARLQALERHWRGGRWAPCGRRRRGGSGG